MSVREYIGARYVPVFANPLEWNASNTYEPLTIVLYQGNSYTSRQAVPAGIEITNAAYWAQTGNYNAQIEQYRQEVQALDTEIDNLLPISIANGGTGATDAAGARTAIDAAQSNGATNTLYDAELAIAENAADIADLQDSAARKTGAFTLKPNFSSATTNVYVYQCGHVIVVGGFINNLSLSANTTYELGTITNVPLPIYAIRGRCGYGNNAYNAGNGGYITIGTNGLLTINTSSSGGNTVYFNLMYIA